MRQWIVAVLVLAAVAIVQCYFLTWFRLAEVRFDLMMAVLIAWAFVRGIDEAMVVVPIGGLMVSLFSQEPLGTSVIAYAPIVPIALISQLNNQIGAEPLLAAAVALACTFAQSVLYLLILDGTGSSPDWTRGMIDISIPAAFMNMLAAPLLIIAMRRLDLDRPLSEAAISFARPRRSRSRRLEFR
jgi:rod shape-determining protein MreD